MKKKKTIKYKSADDKRKALEAEVFQKNMEKRWNITQSNSNRRSVSTKEYVMNTSYRGSDQKIPSVPLTGGVCAKPLTHVYTGTLIKGISTMHKSNAVPVTSQEQMIDISKMRRG